ncbi:MAG: TlpA disulfide reductase family protein [Actinomycetota bacterium]|nr:TlpA disulfide reductase family protein [Actinomycetota bacterium]
MLAVVAIAVPPAGLAVVLTARDDDSDASSPSGSTTEECDVRVEGGDGVDVGEPAPEFTLVTLDGGCFSLGDARGRAVVLTFFASWCHPCEEEMPLLEAASEESPDDLQVVAVSYEDLRRDSESFVERLGVTFPAAFDTDGDVAEAYGVRGIPQTFFIDAEGVVQDRVFGITSKPALDEPLDELLAGSS